jgi:Domain of unknown function (DUF4424)
MNQLQRKAVWRGPLFSAFQLPILPRNEAAMPTLNARAVSTAICIFPIGTAASMANDSSAELAIGGLTLMKSEAISMDSEDLYISKDRVRVIYRFTNTSNADIETLVAFPLPDLAGGESEGETPVNYRTSLDFKTLANGRPVALELVEQAAFRGADITAKLADLHIPLSDLDDGFHASINRLPDTAREALIGDGLIESAGEDTQPLWTPKWTLKTSVTRKQTFSAGKTIIVEHSYNPVAGGSVAGALEPRYRSEEWAQSQIKKYCIEKSWLAAFDREGDKRKTPEGAYPYSEIWLSYILTTGANWNGPIKDFRMVIDKGAPEAMVSFCAEGVKKISPTQFEVRRQNFTPVQNIDVLIVNWFQTE